MYYACVYLDHCNNTATIYGVRRFQRLEEEEEEEIRRRWWIRRRRRFSR